MQRRTRIPSEIFNPYDEEINITIIIQNFTICYFFLKKKTVGNKKGQVFRFLIGYQKNRKQEPDIYTHCCH